MASQSIGTQTSSTVAVGQTVQTPDGQGYVYSIEHDWAAVVLDKHAGRSNAPIYWAKLTELKSA